MLTAVHVMGPYWQHDTDRPSSLGELVRAAKDLQRATALDELRQQLGEFVDDLDLPASSLVLAVPPGPDRDAHPVPALAAAVAGRLGTSVGTALVRRRGTDRLRDTPIDRRREVVEAAGYAVSADVSGRSVVLVDDVVLTGTTLGYLAELLVEAGAAEVRAVVVCRTRRASEPRTAR